MRSKALVGCRPCVPHSPKWRIVDPQRLRQYGRTSIKTVAARNSKHSTVILTKLPELINNSIKHLYLHLAEESVISRQFFGYFLLQARRPFPTKMVPKGIKGVHRVLCWCTIRQWDCHICPRVNAEPLHELASYFDDPISVLCRWLPPYVFVSAASSVSNQKPVSTFSDEEKMKPIARIKSAAQTY